MASRWLVELNMQTFNTHPQKKKKIRAKNLINSHHFLTFSMMEKEEKKTIVFHFGITSIASPCITLIYFTMPNTK